MEANKNKVDASLIPTKSWAPKVNNIVRCQYEAGEPRIAIKTLATNISEALQSMMLDEAYNGPHSHVVSFMDWQIFANQDVIKNPNKYWQPGLHINEILARATSSFQLWTGLKRIVLFDERLDVAALSYNYPIIMHNLISQTKSANSNGNLHKSYEGLIDGLQEVVGDWMTRGQAEGSRVQTISYID